MKSVISKKSPARAWVEINQANLLHNLEVAKTRSGCEIMAVVKANAYGHGLIETARIFSEAGVAFLGVANVGEARIIREAGINTHIYLLGSTWAEERKEIVSLNIIPCISSYEEAQHFDTLAQEAGKTLSVHLAIDTGMGRGGFLVNALTQELTKIIKLNNLLIDGIASHFSSSEADPAFTEKQLNDFTISVRNAEKLISPRWKHIANSGGIFSTSLGATNLVRPGLMLYGISPIEEFQRELKPVMTLKARVTIVRTVPKGHSISYGRTYQTKRETKIATIGIGYGDGLFHSISSKGVSVFIDGQPHRILGRITMDQIVIELPENSKIQNGAEVEIFGQQQLATEIAEKAGTIPWEVFTRITPRVQRLYM